MVARSRIGKEETTRAMTSTRTATTLKAFKPPLTVIPNKQRERLALPPHLRRLLITDYTHPLAETPRVDMAEYTTSYPPFFPSILQTYAVLTYFHSTFGPLADAHVEKDIETRRPKAYIDLVLDAEKAKEAAGQHTIVMKPNRDVRLLSASHAFYARLDDLLKPEKREPVKTANATFTVTAELVPAEARMPLRKRWYDVYSSGPPMASARQREGIAMEFAKFKGFAS